MQDSKNILIFLTLTLLGVVIGCGVGYSIDFPVSTFKSWEAVTGNVNFEQIASSRESKTCSEDGTGFPATRPPGKVVECITTHEKIGPSLSSVFYVLLEDGTIWYWAPHVVNDSPSLTLIIGPSIGLLLGITTGVFLIELRMKRKKRPLLQG